MSSQMNDLSPESQKSVQSLPDSKRWDQTSWNLFRAALLLNNTFDAKQFFYKFNNLENKNPLWLGLLLSRAFLEGEIDIEALAEYETIPSQLIGQVYLPEEVLDILVTLFGTCWMIARREPPLSLNLQTKIFYSDYTSAVRLLAANPSLDISVMNKLATDQRDPGIRMNIALRKDLPKNLFRVLAEDLNAAIRFNLAKRDDIPKDIMLNLARDESSTVRKNVAHNTTVPEEIRIIAAL